MCGFFGFSGAPDSANAQEMMGKLSHRGPDSDGLWESDDITLGFRRLSIIGLEDGRQPMFNEDKTLVLVFNGEVYNYKELRARLEEKGHVFSTHTDAETVLHLYEEYDTGALHHLRGMFAFALYDIGRKRLFGARDPFGIKPFYYTNTEDNRFLFGSEIKCFFPFPGFKPVLNEKALAEYLTFQYSVLSETFFAGVYKLPPAHFLLLEKGEPCVTRYFAPLFCPAEMSLDMAVTAIDNAVRDSVSKHLVGDVEVGSFLSSGVDSSYIAACAGACAKADGMPVFKTFTVGFDYENYNEVTYAQQFSEKLGLENHSKMITTDEYWEHLPRVQYFMDEPLADPSAVALYFVSREASKHVKVALSGEGADELFGGYNIYREPMDLRILTSLPSWLRKFLAWAASKLPFDIKGKNFFIRGGMSLEERFIGNAKIFTERERKEILRDNVGAGSPGPQAITRVYYDQVKSEDDVTKMQFLDMHLWMVGDILLKADKMSMAHSLEVRVPFLDREIFRVAAKMPTPYRVNRAGTKYAFRRAAARHVPEDTAARRKLGFPVPIRIWLKEEKYYRKVLSYFNNDAAKRYFKTEALVKLLDDHRAGKKDYSRKIWTVFMFLLWYEQYFAV